MDSNFLDNLPKGTQIHVIIFEDYMLPNGFLTTAPEEHALFFYYINARRTYEELILNKPIIYDGQSDQEYNFEQLFQSIALLYNCKPENLVKAWPVIDKQCDLIGLPKMPDEYQYRFDKSTKNLIQLN